MPPRLSPPRPKARRAEGGRSAVMVKDWPDLAPPLSVSVADQVPNPGLDVPERWKLHASHPTVVTPPIEFLILIAMCVRSVAYGRNVYFDNPTSSPSERRTAMKSTRDDSGWAQSTCIKTDFGSASAVRREAPSRSDSKPGLGPIVPHRCGAAPLPTTP